VPFATTGIHGLSRLNVWWMYLGIQHQRIRPARPQENGAPERMDKTLKAGASCPPRGEVSPPSSGRSIGSGGNTTRNRPARPCAAGPRRHATTPRGGPSRSGCLRSSIPGTTSSNEVTTAGTIRVKRKRLFLANPLRQLPVGLAEVEDGIWSVYFNRVLLARFDKREYLLHD